MIVDGHLVVYARRFPIPATALLPICWFRHWAWAAIGQATAPYANHIIFLFLGGFTLGLHAARKFAPAYCVG